MFLGGVDMIKTSGFRQLVVSPFAQFSSAFVNFARLQIPNRASSLCRYGLSEEIAAKIQSLASDPVEEAMLVATFIMIVYEKELLQARCDLRSWIARKGGVSIEKKMRLAEFAEEFEKSDVWNSQTFSPKTKRQVDSRTQMKGVFHQSNLSWIDANRTRKPIPIPDSTHGLKEHFLCFFPG